MENQKEFDFDLAIEVQVRVFPRNKRMVADPVGVLISFQEKVDTGEGTAQVPVTVSTTRLLEVNDTTSANEGLTTAAAIFVRQALVDMAAELVENDVLPIGQINHEAEAGKPKSKIIVMGKEGRA